ncbi:hypothetical protein CapIbe_007314, partial [Capra ibex]
MEEQLTNFCFFDNLA